MEKSTLDDAMEKVRQFPSTANFQDLIQVRSKCKKKKKSLIKQPHELTYFTHPKSLFFFSHIRLSRPINVIKDLKKLSFYKPTTYPVIFLP